MDDAPGNVTRAAIKAGNEVQRVKRAYAAEGLDVVPEACGLMVKWEATVGGNDAESIGFHGSILLSPDHTSWACPPCNNSILFFLRYPVHLKLLYIRAVPVESERFSFRPGVGE